MKRRDVLSFALKSAGAVVGITLAVPLGIFALTPVLSGDEGPNWQPLGEAGSFARGRIVATTLTLDEGAGRLKKVGVFVWRQSEEDFVIYSRSCTDLGCPLVFDEGSEWFFCPCHGGIFDKQGQRRAGPPKMPMWRYNFRIHNGVVEVDTRSVPPMV